MHGPQRIFVRSDGKQVAFEHAYDYRGNRIVGNTLLDLRIILRIQGSLTIARPYTIGQ